MTLNRSITVLGKAILVMASFVFIGCEKDLGEVGLDQVKNEIVVLGPSIEVPIKTYSKQINPLGISNPSQLLVGGYDDPVFGRADAKFVAQFKLSKLSPDFGDDPVADSVFLLLPLSTDGYGDTSQTVDLVVKEIEKGFVDQEVYYTNSDFQAQREIGRQTVLPRRGEFVRLGKDSVYSAIKIALDPAFFDEKILKPSRLGSQYFTSNENFKQHFKGIEVSAENAKAIQLLNPKSGDFAIRMFFRESPLDTTSIPYDFLINYSETPTLETFYLNLFTQDYSMAAFDLMNQDTVNGEPVVFTQTMSGVNTVFEIPDLSGYDSILVNKAELTVHLREGDVFPYIPPSLLYLRELDSDSLVGAAYPADYGSDIYSPNVDNVGGFVEKEQIRVFSYKFKLTNHINELIHKDRENNPILILPNAQRASANRAIMYGGNASARKMSLKLYYTILPSN